eukprot:6801239-Pyramimonas_sp.AAC.1
MVFTQAAEGLRGYFADRSNTFDAVIVWISLVEYMLAATGSGGGNSGLSALRYRQKGVLG